MSEESLFHCARSLSPTERASFLDEACAGQPELRQRLEALLRAHDDPQSFLDRPAADVRPRVQAIAPPERRAGPYELLEQIGEGGMGTVYLAKQSHPVQRTVAVKVIRAGMDSGQVIARFEAERQALAVMDHPNIARVFDAGTTESGRPYFAMELIRGEPITTYCDARNLTPRQRVELFIPVCLAVQHAHQKGVIHRDLKPSNVLVARFDGIAVPKVIDFGVAKAAGPRLTEHTLATGFGLLVGTLQYMSPEQAQLDPLDVDTRSDIYSLGVLLYELLTGTTPLDKQRLESDAVLEVLRRVRDDEPPQPSTRLGTTARLPHVAVARGLAPRALTEAVRGELDWIVMKALEKERHRRYDSAGALAADLVSFLRDEPVAAGPPSRTYRLRKLARKHRAALRVAVAFALLLVAGAAASAWQAVRATRAYGDAARASAQTLAALKALTDEVIERLMARQVQLTDEDRAFLERVLVHYEGFAAAAGDGPESSRVRAEGHYRVGLIRARLGEHAAAIESFRRSLETCERLVAGEPARAEHHLALARTHHDLGLVLHERGLAHEAAAELGKALEIHDRLASEAPADRLLTAKTRNALGMVLGDTGRDAEAQEHFGRAAEVLAALVAAFPEVAVYRRNLAHSRSNLATTHQRLGRWSDAESEARAVLEIRAELADRFPEGADCRHELALAHTALMWVLDRRGEHAQAAAEGTAARAILAQLAADFPAVPSYRRELGACRRNLALLCAQIGKTDQALAEARSAVALLQPLTQDFPDVPVYRGDLAMAHGVLADLLDGAGESAPAQAASRNALRILAELVADFPAAEEYATQLAARCCNLAKIVLLGGQPSEALGLYDRAIATLAPEGAAPTRADARRYLGMSRHGRALALHTLGRPAEAAAELARAIEVADDPTLRHRYRMGHIRLLLEADAERAVVALSEIADDAHATHAELHEAAILLTMASEQAPSERRASLAARAVGLLARLDAAGYFADEAHAAALRADPRLGPLRGREDFRALRASQRE